MNITHMEIGFNLRYNKGNGNILYLNHEDILIKYETCRRITYGAGDNGVSSGTPDGSWDSESILRMTTFVYR